MVTPILYLGTMDAQFCNCGPNLLWFGDGLLVERTNWGFINDDDPLDIIGHDHKRPPILQMENDWGFLTNTILHGFPILTIPFYRRRFHQKNALDPACKWSQNTLYCYHNPTRWHGFIRCSISPSLTSLIFPFKKFCIINVNQ